MGSAKPGAGLSARYRSLFVIGRGGMGTVEAALEIQKEGFERVVALKRLLPDSARDARRVEMFLREARLAAMLDHTNVVRAFDYGEIDGELFLAMEYVEGQALSRVLRALHDAKDDHDLGVSLTAHVLAEVCEGLHAAHELNDADGQPLLLVHRDVSPQNVMLGYDGHVRLLDFGVAKIEAESVTKTGEVKGKTAYMSPEQAMGDAIDRRSDLFGVGAVLFECLALRRMWGDGTDMDVIRKLALEKPPSLEDVVPGAPAQLYALYTRLVARDAKDRPATAKDVAEELRTLVPQGPEAAARQLVDLLAVQFGAQATEQRDRLTKSLEEVAPDQAIELRESVLPSSQPGATAPRSSATSVSAADATGANPVSVNGPSAGIADPTPEGRSRVWLALVALAFGAIVIWRITSTPSTSTSAATAPTASATPPPPSATASATPVATVITGPVVSAPIAIATATAAAPPTPSAPPTAAVTTAVPRVAPPPVRTATPPASVPAPPPPPIKTAKPPPDVDDHPF